MKAFLKGNDFWEVIEHGFQLPFPQENPTVAQMKRNAEYNVGTYRALSFLHNAVANDIFPKIASCQNAHEVWEALKEEYEGSARDKSVTLLTLKREFKLLKMKETDTIRQYSSKLVDLVTQIRMQGERFPDSRVVDRMLVSLPDRFEPKVAAIEESCDLSRLSVKALIGKLQAHEKRLAMRSEESVEGAFQAKHKGKYLVARSDWQQEANKVEKGKHQAECSRNFDKRDKFPPCPNCRRTNHLEKDCWHKGKPRFYCKNCKKHGHTEKFCKANQVQYRPKQVQQANFIEDQNEEDYMFVAMHSCFVTLEDSWYVDSGCTNHMVRDVKLFTKLDRSIRTRVRLGNGYVVQAEGKGNVSIQTKEGIKTITDVLYIPSLSQNLLSVTQLMKHGYSVHFKQDVCQIFHLHGSEVANVKMVDNSFPLMWSDVKQHVLISKEDETTLWHRRYGHCNVKTLKFLQSSQLSQVFSVFKKFKVLVEKQSGCQLRILRSENGKEYTSKEFDVFCEEHAINHQLTVKYTPQQNGVSERKNRTVMEMARSMLFEKNLPKKFWAEAVHTVVYLLNGLPTRAVEGKTPIEAWFGLKPSAYHLKVFGSICYMHVPATRRTKLDEKVEMGILVGYAAQSKGYRIYNLQSQKMEVYRDVLVDEFAFWSWDDKKIIKESSSQLNEDFNVEQSAAATSRHQNVAETDHDSPPLKVKSLEDVYARCNLATFDPTCFFEASKYDEWMATMKEELAMIEKNKTWSLCPRPEEVVAQSTAEAEYISAVEASNHAIWLRKMLSDMGQPQFDPSLIYVDNTSAIAIAQNPVQHKRTKHVHVKYHVIRQYIKNKQIQLLHCSSDVQLADILTKSLPKQRFEMLREQLGVTRLALKEEC
ncbi:hypothetical protein SLEP1_g7290 [Rubroshorea leprosula]|uniref:Integrase catalytic domain-containing protein n=1 Tax=Rubroshorea leprosula TaxID=152421 RepID=A0AAV5I767_9ROSI|nr:hypothetical protein SLEP1_g7290 [Rubroshorea leprosula]